MQRPGATSRQWRSSGSRASYQGRLNAERIGRLSSDNAQRERLLDIAAGMHVAPEPGFEPNGADEATRPPLRALYRRAHLAVDAKFFDSVRAGLAFVLSMAIATQIAGIHFSPAHWAPKQGKECGRPIVGSSDRNSRARGW